MTLQAGGSSALEQRVLQLFALVREALAGATHALLFVEESAAQRIVDADKAIDALTDEITAVVWEQIDSAPPTELNLHDLVSLLLILPELERSGDLAENIARRATNNLGLELNDTCRGFIKRMGEVAVEMWQTIEVAYASRSTVHVAIDESDEEIDILHTRLTAEIESGEMPASVASDVTLIARFYERLGDHAVNISRRIAGLSGHASHRPGESADDPPD
jgi:phosphate transport system protein